MGVKMEDEFECEFCGETLGFRCIKESAASVCPDAPTLAQIAEYEAKWKAED